MILPISFNTDNDAGGDGDGNADVEGDVDSDASANTTAISVICIVKLNTALNNRSRECWHRHWSVCSISLSQVAISYTYRVSQV